jgi:hypothetical protein
MRLSAFVTRGVGLVRDFFPLTTLGVVIGVIGLIAHVVLARDSADFILLAVGITALALVGLSLASILIFTPIFAVFVRRAPSTLPEQLVTDVEIETGFATRGFRFWPLLDVRWVWRVPEGVDVRIVRRRGRLVESVTPTERGRYEFVERRFTVRDVFGFASISFSRRWTSPLRILPVVGRANVELAIRRATDEGYSHPSGQPLGELVDMRRYRAGDSVRHIIWKAFARSRRLMVREPERAIAPKPAMVGYFIAGPNDEPSASTARLFLEQGLLGADFVFSAAGARQATANTVDAVEQIVESRAHRDVGADGLAGLLRTVDRGRLDNLVVFAPAGDGAWVDRLIEQTRRLPRPPMVIMTVDGRVEAAAPRRRFRRLRDRLFAPPDDRRRELASVADVHERLRRAGAEVKLLHKGSGSRLDAVTVDAWRAAA